MPLDDPSQHDWCCGLTVCLVRWHRLTLQEYLNDMCCTAYRFACYSEAVSTYEGGRYR